VSDLRKGDWIMYLRNGALALGVIRYARDRDSYPWCKEFLTDEHVVQADAIVEARREPIP
jgi:hypothetical protein